MPIKKIETNSDHSWGLWRIDEDETTLSKGINSTELIPVRLTNTVKRLEWLAGRQLTKALMEQRGLAFAGIVKDTFGKPFPEGSPYQLSLSHSYPYVAAYLHERVSVGIDLEQPKEKLLRVAPRIMHPGELKDAGQDLIKHCLYWCAKEVLVKVHGKKDLIFARDLRITPFSIAKAGEITGSIIVDNTETRVPLYYEVHPEFTLVLNKPG